jgi:monofunctional biosynthetic peptidoglycan transglycosylase
MTDAKPRNWRRVALGTGALVLAWLVGVWPPPVWWRNHWPRETAMMREAARWKDGTLERSNRPTFHPTALKDISPALQRMVIIGEDSRFRMHHGIDPAEIADALGMNDARGFWSAVATTWRHRDRLRGASTITQQLAKNLYLSSSRSPLRKVKEAATALGLEAALPKDRILELYLNVAEWGPGLWGIDAASRAYFGVAPSRLTEEQAAELAATLPHPRTSTPTFRPERTLERRGLILARYRGVDVYIPPEEETDTVPMALIPPLIPPALESLTVAVPVPADSEQDSLHARRTGATDAQWRTADSVPDSLP